MCSAPVEGCNDGMHPYQGARYVRGERSVKQVLCGRCRRVVTVGPRGPAYANANARTGNVPKDLHFDRGAKDRKSTRLNSSHGYISYAVFCLKKKKKKNIKNRVYMTI